jgi:hypothetical protein
VSAVWVVARLAWLRLRRGRALWVSGLLVLAPIALALTAGLRIDDPGRRWSLVAELAFRSLVLLAPVIHLAAALGEETEDKTYTYLWSRPIAREAVLLGKMLAIAPVFALLAPLALAVCYLLVATGPGEVPLEWLGRAAAASALGVVSSSAFALGFGALVPRHALVAALAWRFLSENVLASIGAVQNLSALYHVEVIADLPEKPVDTSGRPLGAAVALLALTAVWLAVGLWRARVVEPGSQAG